MRNCLWVACIMFVLGCASEGNEAPARQRTAERKEAARQRANTGEETKAVYTHTIGEETEYYTNGPQQARPPDGTFKAGTKVRLVRDAGSYSLVESAEGVRAYVSTDSLEEATETALGREALRAAEASNEFAWDLYRELGRQEEGNLFFSPYSISAALAMTYGGAAGETKAQMAEVLHFSLPDEQLHLAQAALGNRLRSQEGAGYELHVANRLWGQWGYDFRPEYLELTRGSYGAELAAVDFARQASDARRQINAWIEEQTQDRIQDLIPEGMLDEMTRLVLTNAVYFKGDWKEPFEQELTEEADFHVAADAKVKVPLMQRTGKYRYGQTESLQLLELPYAGEELSMVVLLPEQVEGLAEVEQELGQGALAGWLEEMRSEEVRVYLPRFKLESQLGLNAVLESLGMTLAFDADRADFSAISTSEQLFISAAIHKAYVDVNEEGTEAAAATGIAVGITSVREQPPLFRADHPFLFLIRDNRSGAILFVGRLVEPA